MVRADLKGEIPMNRPHHFEAKRHRQKKMMARSNWFKRSRDQEPDHGGQDNSNVRSSNMKVTDQPNPPETVMFVPHTPGGQLKKILQGIDDQVTSGQYGKVRMVEKLGNTLIQSIGNQAPWRSSHCGRLDFWPCKSKEGACRKHSVVYRITCLTCKAEGRSKQYWGETHRTAWDRSRDHLQALRTKDDTYAVV